MYSIFENVFTHGCEHGFGFGHGHEWNGKYNLIDIFWSLISDGKCAANCLMILLYLDSAHGFLFSVDHSRYWKISMRWCFWSVKRGSLSAEFQHQRQFVQDFHTRKRNRWNRFIHFSLFGSLALRRVQMKQNEIIFQET